MQHNYYVEIMHLGYAMLSHIWIPIYITTSVAWNYKTTLSFLVDTSKINVV